MKSKPPEYITIQELRECPEFSHLDDCLAQNVITSIQEFCSIIANQYHNLSGEQKIEAEPNNNKKTIKKTFD